MRLGQYECHLPGRWAGYLSAPAGVEQRQAMGKCGMLIWLIGFQTKECNLKKAWYTEEDDLVLISPQQE